MTELTSVAVLGCSGSIGTQTAEVMRAESGRYRVSALAAWRSVDVLVAQAREFEPDVVAIIDESLYREVREALSPSVEVVAGSSALCELPERADVTVNAVVGFAGLDVTLSTLRAGRRLALANKESLIAAGPVVQPLRDIPGAEIVPVDSEHCAIHQCLRAGEYGSGGDPLHLSRVLLTASGGPFRGRSAEDLAKVTVEQALDHPTWTMGPKITVDSSTLMNKGLEVIEAHELFGVDYDDIDVVVHPQSVVHSMAEFTDGSTIAQLSMPDMRLPIGYALAYPDRIGSAFGRIDWTDLSRLDFEQPDRATFRCLDLAYEAGRRGGTAPAWVNAANEVAVQAFLDGKIRWTAIAEVLYEVLESHDGTEATSAEVVVNIDAQARRVAADRIARLS
ncbi:MAG: 1-deoxy-D-xylulose-5-phosphate reductoisomerase [Actinomycetia bacterium]|nr:1-deoxy-D-xylulose-5-phosphate reductoisomerase [Actinomycetes bacterium]MCP4962513.1 1-deoxy-D-xylulose-5-phosphate reductoisomerase [Actinomycetes bacterium]